MTENNAEGPGPGRPKTILGEDEILATLNFASKYQKWPSISWMRINLHVSWQRAQGILAEAKRRAGADIDIWKAEQI